MSIYRMIFLFLAVILAGKLVFAFKPMNISEVQLDNAIERAEKIDKANFDEIIDILKSKLLIDHDKLDNKDNKTVRLFETILKTDYRQKMINEVLNRIDFLKKIGTVPGKYIKDIENFLKKYDIYKKEVFSRQDLKEEILKLKRVVRKANSLINKIVKMLERLEIKE